jgi:hypothetical protein
LAAILAQGVHECAKFLRILADRFKFGGLSALSRACVKIGREHEIAAYIRA